MAAHALIQSRLEWTAKWPPRRVRGAPALAGTAEPAWSGVIGDGGRSTTGAHESAAEPLFVGDDTLRGDLAVDRHDGRVPAAAAQGVKEVVEPGLDADFDIGEVGGDALDEADGEVALLADGVRDVDEELPAGHGVNGDDGRGRDGSR